MVANTQFGQGIKPLVLKSFDFIWDYRIWIALRWTWLERTAGKCALFHVTMRPLRFWISDSAQNDEFKVLVSIARLHVSHAEMSEISTYFPRSFLGDPQMVSCRRVLSLKQQRIFISFIEVLWFSIDDCKDESEQRTKYLVLRSVGPLQFSGRAVSRHFSHYLLGFWCWSQ